MIPLIKVELTRMWWRRAVLVLLAPRGPAAGRRLRVPRGRHPHDGHRRRLAQIRLLRLRRGRGLRGTPGQYGVERADDVRTACEQVVAGWYGNSPLDLVEEREKGGAIAAMALMVMLLLLAGTTFAGHDWNTGSMSNQLLFEPRRERVWAAKALAVGLVSGALALAVLAAYWTGMWATMSLRDLPIQEHAVAAGVQAGGAGRRLRCRGRAVRLRPHDAAAQHGRHAGPAVRGRVPRIVVVAGVLGVGGAAERFMPWGNFYAYAVGGYEFYDFGPLDAYRRAAATRPQLHHPRPARPSTSAHPAVTVVPVAPDLPRARPALGGSELARCSARPWPGSSRARSRAATGPRRSRRRRGGPGSSPTRVRRRRPARP